MNQSSRKTWEDLFAARPPKSLRADKVESLLVALGFTLRQGAGSRVRYVGPEGEVLMFHRPHQKELKAYQVWEIRKFLAQHGMKPTR